MPDKYSIAALLLVVTAGVMIALALVTDTGESVTVALVIAGMICAITGIFILAFSGDEPVDPRLIGIIPAQGSIKFSRIMHHFDIHGKAHFLPPAVAGEPGHAVQSDLNGEDKHRIHSRILPGNRSPGTCYNTLISTVDRSS